MIIEKDLYEQLLQAFPPVPPENGCILGAIGGTVCAFVYDGGSTITDRAVYYPDVSRLNRIIDRWTAEGIRFAGLCHSHPPDQFSLSGSDVSYIRTIMSCMPDSIEELYFPLVFPGQALLSFTARRHGEGVEILPDHIIIKP